MLKVELHAHTNRDPRDRISHSTEALIDHARRLGYDALAVTLHDRYFDPAPCVDYASARGIVLLSGIERTIDGKHLLLINVPADCASVRTVDDVSALKARSHGLVIAPHSFYPTKTALGSTIDRWAAVIDAVEVNAMYTRQLNFNRKAVEWARAHGKPLVGNSDIHVLSQMGTTYSLVDAEPNADAICEAIRSGRVQVKSEPQSWALVTTAFFQMAWRGIAGRLGAAWRGDHV